MTILYSIIIQFAGFWLLETEPKAGILLIIIGLIISGKIPFKKTTHHKPTIKKH